MNNEIFTKPWGNYKTIETTSAFQVKVVTVNPSQRLSLQSHLHRDEHWTVVTGSGSVQVGDKILPANLNDSFFIPRTVNHRLVNTGDEDLVVIEVQTGVYFGEDDIERYEDDYGRVK